MNIFAKDRGVYSYKPNLQNRIARELSQCQPPGNHAKKARHNIPKTHTVVDPIASGTLRTIYFAVGMKLH